jgi:hypothetical protein
VSRIEEIGHMGERSEMQLTFGNELKVSVEKTNRQVLFIDCPLLFLYHVKTSTYSSYSFLFLVLFTLNPKDSKPGLTDTL